MVSGQIIFQAVVNCQKRCMASARLQPNGCTQYSLHPTLHTSSNFLLPAGRHQCMVSHSCSYAYACLVLDPRHLARRFLIRNFLPALHSQRHDACGWCLSALKQACCALQAPSPILRSSWLCPFCMPTLWPVVL